MIPGLISVKYTVCTVVIIPMPIPLINRADINANGEFNHLDVAANPNDVERI